MTYYQLLILVLAFPVIVLGCSQQQNPDNSASKAPKWEDLTPEIKVIEKAAEGGSAEAQLDLALKLVSGSGIEKNPQKAFEWMMKSAEGGNTQAMYFVGDAYDRGVGVSRDSEKSISWMKRAAEGGDVDAQDHLGHVYVQGEVVKKDLSEAFKWFHKAAGQGNASAAYNLGLMYRQGWGVEKNIAKAVEWYRIGAEKGNPSAQYMFGWMYDYGQGVPKSSTKAFEWYRKAAEQNLAIAQSALGFMYKDGNGISKDWVLSYVWFNLAASQGHDGATESRDSVERGLSKTALIEAQLISSAWKPGTAAMREREASVDVVSKDPRGKLSKQRTGTVFFVGKEGQAITNHHVIQGCDELRIGGREGVAKLITDDKVNDLALLQIPGEIKALAPISDAPTKLRQGEDIVVFGFPLNSLLSSGGNLTPGVVSALTGLGNNTNQIQITAPIQPGSSGSPVLNKKGQVVAVVSMKLSDSKMANATGQIGQNVNFAVSGQTLKPFLDTHKVEYRSGGMFSFEKSTADLADEARKWTSVVECWK